MAKPTDDLLQESRHRARDSSIEGEVRVAYTPASTAPTVQVLRLRTRYFECTEGGSSKFWEITLCNDYHSVRFGRIGTTGQELTRSFSGPQQARADCERLVRQKIAKGYQERHSSSP